jgi:Family of unknown function (DUF6174)
MKALVVSLMIAGALVGCGDGPVSVAEQVELTQHEGLWQQQGIHSYDFDLVTQQLGQTHDLHVGVRADTVASIVDNDTGLPPVFPVSAMTVDEVFTDANSAIANKKLKVTLEFDDQYGYPTLFTMGSIENTPGGPFSAKLSNLVPVP